MTAWADAALAEIRTLALSPARLTMDAATLLAERAALMNLPRPGRVSAGGACHLLDCADGAIGLSLPRPDDWQLLPALFEDASPGNWAAVEQAVRSRKVDPLVERARLLGLAVARADILPPPPTAYGYSPIAR